MIVRHSMYFSIHAYFLPFIDVPLSEVGSKTPKKIQNIVMEINCLHNFRINWKAAPSQGKRQGSSEQALRNSCELLRQRKELHASSRNCMQAHGTSCKLIEFHDSSGNCMQRKDLISYLEAQATACKLRELHAS